MVSTRASPGWCLEMNYVVQDVAHSIQSVTNKITQTTGKNSQAVWDQL